MADFILINGDIATFQPSFGAATVTVAPGTLSGSAPCKAVGQVVCIEGDEGSVSVPGCPYISGAYVTPGTGTITIDALGSDQVAEKTKSGDTPVMLKGGTFTAKFSVSSPAMQPPPGPGSPTPDPTTEYSGSGNFTTTNTSVKAT